MKPLVVALPLLLLSGLSAAGAADGPFVGLDLGYSHPTNSNYRAHVHDGATANPYAGYMFNDYLGLQGQIHATFQTPDDDDRGFKHENQTTTLLGATFGPRLVVPLGEMVDVYATGQGGVFTGLSGRLNHTAPGFSVGAGIDYNITPQVAVGLFGRWNRAYMSPRPTDLGPTQVDSQRYGEDAQWLTAGLGVKYAFNGPADAPVRPSPPPAVAQAPAPAPPAKKKIVLRAVHFDFDKSNIRADAMPVLDEAVDVLKTQDTIAVVVEGHTDSKGSDQYNEKLSQRRADAVRQYFIKHGVSATRIKTEGFGESRPVTSNDTDDGRAQNRRVELRVE